MKPGYLSDNFKLSEFTKSQIATRKGIDNSPTEEHLSNMEKLCENVLEKVRREFFIRYRKGLFLSSGYRSKALNEAIEGSEKSQHCKGMAADVDGDVNGLPNSEIFDFIVSNKNIDFDQLIWEYGNDESPEWIHVSFDPGKEVQRGEILRTVVDKKTGKLKGYKKFKI